MMRVTLSADTEHMSPQIHIRSFHNDDIPPLTDILVRMGQAGSPYPPLQDVDGTHESMHAWLMNESATRWVITVDGAPAGHILLSPAHDYLYSHLATQGVDYPAGTLHEVGKFFVDPAHRKHGLGHRLIDHLMEYATGEHLAVALSVIDTSTDAIHFYKHKGFQPHGSFHGRHGVNYVFQVI